MTDTATMIGSPLRRPLVGSLLTALIASLLSVLALPFLAAPATAAAEGWTLTLTPDRTGFFTHQAVELTATTNQEIFWSGYRVEIRDKTTDAVVKTCTSGSNGTEDTCIAYGGYETGDPHTYYAVLVDVTDNTVAMTSNEVQVARKPWTITLEKTPTNQIEATTNQPYNEGPFTVSIYLEAPGGGPSGDPYHTCTDNAGASQTKCYKTLTTGNAALPFYAEVTDNDGFVHANSYGFSADTGYVPFDPDTTVGGGNPSANNCQCPVIDPVNTATGEFYENVTDLALPGRFPMTWGRSYSSSRITNTVLGRGWTSFLDMRVEAPTGAPVRVVQENGSATDFNYTGNGQTTPVTPNITATLSNTNGTSGNWVFTRRDGTVFTFNNAGLLTQVRDRNNEGLTLVRGNSTHPERVTSITGDVGTFTLAYNTAGLIETVTATGGQTVTYGYDTGNHLTTVTDALNHAWTYTYNTDHRLVSQTDPEGGTTTNTYDTHGRVEVQEDPLGGDSTLTYSAAPGITETDGTTFTTVTDQAGRVTKYVYDNGQLVKRIQDPAGTSPRTWKYVNSPGGQPVLIVDPLNHPTFLTYNAQGDRTSAKDATGNVTEWTYNTFGDIAVSVTLRPTQTT